MNRRRLATTGIAYGLLTGASRVAGLAREIMAASYFGVSGAMSAFIIAFQVPNLVRALVADVALEGGLIPVMTELLERGRRRDAVQLILSLSLVITVGLGALTALAVVLAPVYMPLFAPGFGAPLEQLLVGLAQVMVPIVPLLSLGAVLTGTLYAHERFLIPAMGPVLWNVVVMVALVVLVPLFEADDRLYAYSVGVLLATVAQVALPLPWMSKLDLPWHVSIDWRSPELRRVLALMLPVTIAWGGINLMLLMDSLVGTFVGARVPAAIDKAFRLYQLPQGIFAVAISAILFTALARAAAREDMDELRRTAADGIRYLALALIPAAVGLAVLAHPIVALAFERGAFQPRDTDLVSAAVVWWAVSLPLSGMSLLLVRIFLALRHPWDVARITLVMLAINAVLAGALYKPFGMEGIIVATVVATSAGAALQILRLRTYLAPWDLRQVGVAVVRMLAGGAALGVVARVTYEWLGPQLDHTVLGAAVALIVPLTLGSGCYVLALIALKASEPRELGALLRRSTARDRDD